MPLGADHRGRRATEISNGITRLHRDHYGRGATSARTEIGRDYSITVLEDIFTPMERTLIDAGGHEVVRQTRLACQRALRDRFIEVVESVTGRAVRAFVSQVHFDPDIAVELFFLEPDAAE